MTIAGWRDNVLTHTSHSDIVEDGKAVHRVQRSCASYNNRHKTLWSLACFPQKPLAACVELTPAITCTKEHFLTMTVTTVCMWEDAVRTYCTCSRAWHDTSMCKWAGVMNRQSWSVSGLLVGICTGLNTESICRAKQTKAHRAWLHVKQSLNDMSVGR